MRLWVAYLREDQLDADFDPALHCDESLDGYKFTMSEVEGQAATVEIERPQAGYEIITSAGKRVILVSWSPTGEKADARLLARARVNAMPDDLFGRRQTIKGICAPRDIKDRLLEYAKDKLDRRPHFDRLFADCDDNDAASFLIARTEAFRIDPATHAIELISETAGTRTVDLADLALPGKSGPSTKPGAFGSPVASRRAEIVVQWTVEVSDEVNVASRFGIGGRFDSLDPKFDFTNALILKNGKGWTLAGEGNYIRLVERHPEAQANPIRGTYEIVRDEFVGVADGQGPGGYAYSGKRAESALVQLTPLFDVHTYQAETVTFQFEYAQDYEEKLFAVMDVNVPSSVIQEEDLEALEFTLGNIFEDPEVPDWEYRTNYLKGDRVRYDGRYYECLFDHFSLTFTQPAQTTLIDVPVTIGDAVVSSSLINTTNWRRYKPTGLLDKESLNSFFATPRGRLVIEHVMLRLRKDLLRRLRVYHVELPYRWSDAGDVTTRDSVRILANFGDGTSRPVFGKVYAVKRSWDKDRARVDVEIAISVGDGTYDPPVTVPGYAEPDVWEPGYEYGGQDGVDYACTSTADGGGEPAFVSRAYLSTPGGAVESSNTTFQAAAQFTRLIDVVDAGQEMDQVSVIYPTTVELRMRDISPKAPIVRDVDAVGRLFNSPRGIVL